MCIRDRGNLYTQLLSVLGGTERLKEILLKPAEVAFDKVPKMKPALIKADVSFEQVLFSYPSRADIKVLKNISFKIKAGQKIAFVGMSGAGKSTIAQLLLRFYDIQSGEILSLIHI